jgi:transcriptional regulator
VTIYTPRSFAMTEQSTIARLVREHPFATLITPGDPEPFISHLPLELSEDPAPHGALIGHMARANPHWRHFGNGESIAVFHGPHAYVSPSWYADPANAVPTWNYAVAHVHGIAAAMTDPSDTRALLDRLIHRYEGNRAQPWKLQVQGPALDALLAAIVGFRLSIERVDAKLKLSQNRSVEDRDRVIAALRGEPHPDANATAAWMDRYARKG